MPNLFLAIKKMLNKNLKLSLFCAILVIFSNSTFSLEKDSIAATKTIKYQEPIKIKRDSITVNGKSFDTEKEVKLVDEKATENTKKLYSYLSTVGRTEAVLLGHQNDTNHKAGTIANGTNSDIKDITGSLAAVYGIDVISLTGVDFSSINWNSPLKERVKVVANGTKEAVKEGAIVALTAHMPNFEVIAKRVGNQNSTNNSSDTVGILADGSYNFSGYSSSDLKGNVVQRIMPRNDLNKYFTAYLDMIALYAKELEKDNISLMFRPFHENTGSWFWWGKAFCDPQAYKNLYRYTVEYLKNEKGVHNILYVYGPGSEANNIDEYSERYPGNEYVDMVGFDMYHSSPEKEDQFMKNFKNQVSLVDSFAKQNNKLFAVTETGVSNGNAALLKSGNKRMDWYKEILDILSPTSASYFLVWVNFGKESSFYTPYLTKKEKGVMEGHEMLDNFIEFYNDERSIFASEVGNFKDLKVKVNKNKEIYGFLASPSSGVSVSDALEIKAIINNLKSKSKVKFVIKDKEGNVKEESVAKVNKNNEYSGVFSKNQINNVGETPGFLSIVVDNEIVDTINLQFNKRELKLDDSIIDTFENYYGDKNLLQAKWSSGNGSGCSLSYTLSNDQKLSGDYGLRMNYKLTAGGYVGIFKSLNANWSNKDAVELWITPDGKNQKTVIQVQSAGNCFEVYLNEYDEFKNITKPTLVTIPFKSFKGRDDKNAKFDSSNIQSFGLWLNAIVPNGVDPNKYELNSVIYYDEIKVINSTKTKVTFN